MRRLRDFVLDRIKRVLRANAHLFELSRRVYGAAVLRFANRRNYVRYRLTYLLRALATLVHKEKLVGGLMTSDGEFYLRTPDGIFLSYNFADPDRTLGDGQSLEFTEPDPDRRVERLLCDQLRDSAVYVDVGANNGYFYALKVAKAQPRCRVYAFEPDRRIVAAFRKNVAFNGAANVTLVEIALADGAGHARMPAFAGASGWLVTDGSDEGSLLQDVAVSTLDRYVAEQGIDRVDAIKVDIEGGEYRFLAGATETLRRFRPLVVAELREEWLRRSGASTAEVIELCRRLDYAVFRVRDSSDAVLVPGERSRALAEQHRDWLDAMAPA